MIIGLSGYARSGKDTVANYLVEKHGFTRIAFADLMREALEKLNPWIQMDEMIRVPLATALRAYSWEELKSHSDDIRPMLQRFGTEVGREMFGQDFWVNLALERAYKHDNVVFSDVRFQNEADAIYRDFGSIWRINRAGTGPVNDHPSETEMDSYKRFDCVIDNDFSVEHLYTCVDMTLLKSRL